MKVVDYEALKAFKARLDGLYATKATTESLAGDVANVKELSESIKENLTWK